MKKSLLLSLVALACWGTVGAQTVEPNSGSGTQADPYVYTVVDGSQVFIAGGNYAIFEFDAPSAGELTFTPDTYAAYWWMMEDANGDWTTVNRNHEYSDASDAFSLTAAGSYRFKTNVSAWSDATVSVVFTAAGADALTVVSATPAAGSAVASISPDSPITLVMNKTVGYLRGSLSGFESGANEVVLTDAATNTYTFAPVDLSDLGRDNTWVLYEGTTYTLTLEAYDSYDDWNSGVVSPNEVTAITYVGATAAEVYSDIKLINVTPAVDETDPALMASSTNPDVVFEFDGLVDVQSVGIALGQGMGTVPISYSVAETDGHTFLTATLEGSANDAYLTVYFPVKDKEGLSLNDQDGPYSSYFGNSAYTIDIPWADGRAVDYLISYDELAPADGEYVESLSQITFTTSGAADVDHYYARTFLANAGVYDEAGTKLYDVVLTQRESADATGMGTFWGSTPYFVATVCELGSVDYDNETYTPATITTPGVYVVKIDSMSIGDGNFDPNMPYAAALGGAKGRCNPTWSWTYNVVNELVEVVSVDPAPYVEGGEWSAAIPAEVKITLNSADFTVESAVVRYGMNSFTPIEPVVSGEVITLAMPEAALSQNYVAVMVTAVASNGQYVNYNNDPTSGLSQIMLVYQLAKNTFVPVVVEPADGSTVESLTEVRLFTDESQWIGTLSSDKIVTLTGVNSNLYVECGVDYGVENMNELVITFGSTITAEDTYRLYVPEGTFYDLDDNLYNPELNYTFVVDNDGAIKAIATDKNGKVKVYSLQGIYLGEGMLQDMLNKLDAGIYIINGTKIALKK